MLVDDALELPILCLASPCSLLALQPRSQREEAAKRGRQSGWSVSREDSYRERASKHGRATLAH